MLQSALQPNQQKGRPANTTGVVVSRIPSVAMRRRDAKREKRERKRDNRIHTPLGIRAFALLTIYFPVGDNEATTRDTSVLKFDDRISPGTRAVP